MVTEDEVERLAEELDCNSLCKAQALFTKIFGAEVEQNCTRLMEEVAKCYLAINNGERPRKFGAFDRDEIERILTYDLNFTYKNYEVADGADFANSDFPEQCITMDDMLMPSEEAWTRYKLVVALKKYLETAAAFAKSIGAIPASRLYMRAFLILEPMYYGSNLSPEDVHRFAMFEKIATEMLIVDYLAYKLPPFKPREVTPVKKPAKKLAAKAKGGAK